MILIRKVVFFVIFFCIFTTEAFAESILSKALTEGYLRGRIKTYFFQRDFDVKNTSQDFATGCLLWYQTAPVNGFSAGLAYYSSFGLGLNNSDKNVYGLLERDGNGDHKDMSLLGEGFVQWDGGNTTLTIGRQGINTPWLNTNDIRITPQSFEAATITNRDIKDLEIFFSHVTKIKGYSTTTFASMTEFGGIMDPDKPLTIGGLVYTGFDGSKIQLWDYFAHDYFNGLYIRAEGCKKIGEELSWLWGAQLFNQRDVGLAVGGSQSTNLLGLRWGIGVYGLNLCLNYCEVTDEGIFRPWGNNHFTYAQINDCSRAQEKAVSVEVGYDLGRIGIKGLYANFIYFDANTPDSGPNASPDRDETSFDLRYSLNHILKGVSLRARYSILDEDEALGGDDYGDFRLYFIYDFDIL